MEVTRVTKQTGSGAVAWAVGLVVWGLAWGLAAAAVGVALYVAYLRYANRTRARPCSTPETMEGKTVLVTGNDDGEEVGEEGKGGWKGKGGG